MEYAVLAINSIAIYKFTHSDRAKTHSVINEYNRGTREGEQSEIGKYCGGFLGGFGVCTGTVQRTSYDGYLGQNIDSYGGREFDVIPIVYPATKDVWPR